MTHEADRIAVETIKARYENKGRKRADWYDWCERVGFTEYNSYAKPQGRKYWARETFKAALKVMSPSDPERWKYEVGAKYAPFRYQSESGAAAFRDYITIFAQVVISMAAWILGLALGMTEYPILLVAPIAVVCGWGYYFIKRYLTLSR